MLFLIGVAMAVAGVGFCLMGEIKLFGGRVLRPLYAQICGVVFLSYFPLYFVIFPFIRNWDLIYGNLLTWGLATVCFLMVLTIIMRTTQPAKPARSYQAKLSASSAPFAEDEQPTGADDESFAAGDERSDQKNPFDFK